MSEQDARTTSEPPNASEPTLDGVFSAEGIDLTVIRWMLQMSPVERLQAVQDLIDAASALRPVDDT